MSLTICSIALHLAQQEQSHIVGLTPSMDLPGIASYLDDIKIASKFLQSYKGSQGTFNS